MFTISRSEFEELVSQAVARLPEPHASHLQNVAFIVDDEPTAEQRVKLKLRGDQTLFGLYEGVPLSHRQGVTKLLPDKITIFQKPIESVSNNSGQLQDQIGRTVWHEIAHYYGLDHERIHELERKELEQLMRRQGL